MRAGALREVLLVYQEVLRDSFTYSDPIICTEVMKKRAIKFPLFGVSVSFDP